MTIFGHSFADDKLVNERTAMKIVKDNMMNISIALSFLSGIYRCFFQIRAMLCKRVGFVRTMSTALYNHRYIRNKRRTGKVNKNRLQISYEIEIVFSRIILSTKTKAESIPRTILPTTHFFFHLSKNKFIC